MFNLNPVEWFVGFPPELAVFFLSMIPITELRAAIPIGIEVYKLPVFTTWILAILGDIIPAIFILLLVPVLHDWVVKRRFLGPVLTKYLKRAEKTFSGKYEKYGLIAFVIFVAIPLPVTGSWTASFASFIFNIPFKKAFPPIFLGVCLAATFVTLITLFAGGALRWLF
ncbi:MAG: ligand-binding protein SH3 [Candidatus Magasanikbacteria bacterium]|nr:ligand-binding protein SH3 [Candidatus Magasanikbacteria bacterium]